MCKTVPWEKIDDTKGRCGKAIEYFLTLPYERQLKYYHLARSLTCFEETGCREYDCHSAGMDFWYYIDLILKCLEDNFTED